jgi:hypothetical protein
MTKSESRPLGVTLLLVLLAFQGLSGILGGVFLVLDPTGNLLQMPVSMLEDSPFRDFFIPGLILLIVLGILPVVVLYSLWKKDRWAWFGSLLVGMALMIWIGVQILMIGYYSKVPLQLIYGLVGFFIVVLTFLPSVRNYYP